MLYLVLITHVVTTKTIFFKLAETMYYPYFPAPSAVAKTHVNKMSIKSMAMYLECCSGEKLEHTVWRCWNKCNMSGICGILVFLSYQVLYQVI